MKVYLLEVYPEYQNGQISKAWNGLVYSTMKGACRYGERLCRRFGHKYRVRTCYVMKYYKESLF